MAINCDSASLTSGAKCYECLPCGLLTAVETYFMAVEAGGSLDPQTLITAASHYRILTGIQLPVQVYLLATMAGVSTDSNTIGGLARCGTCIPPGQKEEVNTSLWQVASGAPFDPTSSLPTAVSNFRIISGMTGAVQTMLLNRISGLNLTPEQLATRAGCLQCLESGTLSDAYTRLLCLWIQTLADNRITWTPDTVGGKYNGGTPFANLADFRSVDPTTVNSITFDTAIDPTPIASISNIQTLTNLHTVTMKNQLAGTPLDIHGMTNVTSVLLTNCNISTLNLVGCSGLVSLGITNGTVSALDCTGCSSLLGVIISGLTGSGTATFGAGCTTLETPLLSGNHWTSINLSGCTNLRGLEAGNNPTLTSLTIAAGLTSLGQDSGGGTPNFSVQNCPLLTFFTFQNSIFIDAGEGVNFNGCGLDQPSVSNALILMNNQGDLTTLTIDFAGGTNAHPNPSGVTAANDLVTNGCAVSIN